MRYVQAQRPDGHNGGEFFEHEIHMDEPGGWDIKAARERAVLDYLAERNLQRHEDYRFRSRTHYDRIPSGDGWAVSTAIRHHMVIRFKSKDEALLFKLSWRS